MKGAIRALRRAWRSDDPLVGQALEDGGAHILRGHHLGHRGARHARVVAEIVDAPAPPPAGSVRSQEKPFEKDEEPGSQSSQKTKIATRNVAEANSGIEVVSTERMVIARSRRLASAMPDSTPRTSEMATVHDEDAAAEDGRIGEPRRQELQDRRAELRRIRSSRR